MEKFPYLARQINGPIANSFGKGIDSVYEKDRDFIQFLSSFSLSSLGGKWLDMLGIILGAPRPYMTIPTLPEVFKFDKVGRMLVGTRHGFSSDSDYTESGKTYKYVKDTADPGKGYLTDNGEKICGQFDDVYRSQHTVPISDSQYRLYLQNISLAKRKHSVSGICDVVQTFVKSYRYTVGFVNNDNYKNDIFITIAGNLEDYSDTLQKSFNKIFTTAPRVYVVVDAYFEENYIKKDITGMVSDITGSDQFSVSYYYFGNDVIFTVALDPSIISFKDEAERALADKYETYTDIKIVVVEAKS